MMPSTCEEDGGELVYLGGRSAFPGTPSGSYYYCPNCSSAFLLLESNASPGCAQDRPRVVRWRYEKSALIPLSKDHEDAQHHLGHLRKAIDGFLNRRHAFFPRCPLDGGTVPVIGDSIALKCVWCESCSLGSAHYHSPNYGWRVAGTFVFDSAAAQYAIQSFSALQGVRDDVDAALPFLPPPPGCR